MRRIGAGLGALAVAMMLGGAGGGDRAHAYTEGPVPDGGSVVGTVRFVGTPPPAEPIAVRKNTEECGESKPSEALVLGVGQGVRYTVVYLEGIERGKKAADLELDNARCLFVPHVSAVMAGARVRVKNSDALLHNTHGFHERTTLFNIALPTKGQVLDISQRIKKVGVIDVQCDAHTHMRAWIVVRDNPYVQVTDEAGRYRITDVPPGRYRLVAWHEGWVVAGRDKDGRPVYDAPRVLARDVTVSAKGEVRADFELK